MSKNMVINIEYFDWFVVRNPYTRIISEFHCIYGGVGDNYINYNVKQFNEYAGHYAPQYKYICNDANITILRFEKLQEDFNKLMSSRNLKIRLDKHSNKRIKKFNISDFDELTIELIKYKYKRDFELFGYSLDPKKINIIPSRFF